MQRTMILIAALALGAAPAAAQDNAADANAAMSANAAAPATNAADANAADESGMSANEMAAMAANADMTAPPDETAAEPAATPVPQKRGFPWGVIGLVGLVGLLGRRRRD
jgi:MYXO-CTERM domain-containing protein